MYICQNVFINYRTNLHTHRGVISVNFPSHCVCRLTYRELEYNSFMSPSFLHSHELLTLYCIESQRYIFQAPVTFLITGQCIEFQLKYTKR